MSSGTLVKTISMNFVADPGDAPEVMDDLSAKADALGVHPVNVQVLAETGEAQEQLDAVAAALRDLEEAQAQQAEAQERLASVDTEAEGGEQAYAAALDASTAATLRALDAQIRLGEAELAESEKAKEAGDAQLEAAGKTDEGATALGGAGDKLKLFALGAAAAGVVAVKMAGDFEQSMERLVTSAGESQKNMGMVSSGILALSGATNTSTEDLAKGAYTVESAGFHGAHALEVLKAAAEGAAAEGADMGTMANAVTSALNAYHMGAGQAMTITNQMVTAVSQGKMTLEGLAGSLAAVLPVASSAGLSFSQVGGAIATMTSQGMSAEWAAQNLRHTITSLQAPNNTQIEEMQQLGINSTSLAKNLGKEGLTGSLDEVYTAIMSHMGKSREVMLSAFNTSKLAAQAAQTELDNLPKSIQGVAKAYLNGTITQKQWTTALQGMSPLVQHLASQFATSANKAHGFSSMLTSGGSSAQTFNAALQKVMGGQVGLQTALMLTGKHMGIFKANVDAVAASAQHTGKDVNNWGVIQKEFNFQLGSAEKSAKAAAISFGMALMPAVKAILGPVSSAAEWIAKTSGASSALAIIVGGVLTMVLQSKLVSGLKDAKGAVEGLWAGFGKLKSMLPGVAAATEEVSGAEEGAEVAQDGLNVAMDANPIGAVVLALTVLVGGIVLVVTHIKDFKNWISDAFNWIKDHWKLLPALMLGPLGILVTLVLENWKKIEDGTSKAITAVLDWFKALPGRIGGFLSSLPGMMFRAGVNAIEGLIHGIESMASAVGNAVSGIAHKVAGFFGLSPAVEGPLSGGGAPEIRGAHFSHAFASGMLAGSPAVAAAAARVAGAAGAGAGAGGTGSGGSGGVTVHLHFDKLLMGNPDQIARTVQEMLGQLKRHNGGQALGLA